MVPIVIKFWNRHLLIENALHSLSLFLPVQKWPKSPRSQKTYEKEMSSSAVAPLWEGWGAPPNSALGAKGLNIIGFGVCPHLPGDVCEVFLIFNLQTLVSNLRDLGFFYISKKNIGE